MFHRLEEIEGGSGYGLWKARPPDDETLSNDWQWGAIGRLYYNDLLNTLFKSMQGIQLKNKKVNYNHEWSIYLFM